MSIVPVTPEMRSLMSFHNVGKFFSCKWVYFLFVFHLSCHAESRTVVETLPGFSGKLPFKLETGYVSVGDMDEVQLFYYFVESESNPVRDPLILWLTGGPGCSAFSGLVYEIGPLIFDYASFNGSLPPLLKNQYSWTQVGSIIFVDAPVGTGFSYSTTLQGYYSSDTKSTQQLYQFLRKWLLDHPQYIYNPLYIAGDSYSGITVPTVALLISDGNKEGHKPTLNLQGYALGNPVTSYHDDQNSRIDYYHRVALISHELYESIKESCKGEYIDLDPSNSKCIEDIGLVAECTIQINVAQILEPKCSLNSPKPKNMTWGSELIDDVPDEIIQTPTSGVRNWCRNNNYVLSYIWANDASVQEALGIRNGTITDWKRCNHSLIYDSDITSSFDYHLELITRGQRALIYSGDHDTVVPYLATYRWISFLNFTTTDKWRPWFVEGQIAGFTEKYEKAYSGDGLTFATVKGGGHTAPEYRPKQCLAMVDRWFSYYAI